MNKKLKEDNNLDLVEHLGSGMNRILKAYDRSIFHVSDNFLEMELKTQLTGRLNKE
ncbi:MAG: hypothetical protein WBM07_09690 [Chitinivibrionales bacterium]